MFGSGVWTTSLVLSSFMGGLTIGAAVIGRLGHRIRRIRRAYANAEIVVAVSGVVLTYLLPALTGVAGSLASLAGEGGWALNVVHFMAAFAILLVPSTAMGTTLPLLIAELARRRSGFGPALGDAYGWNTLGAVAGVIGAEVWLIGRFGVAGSAWFAALLSLGAAGIAFSRSERLMPAGSEDAAIRTAPGTHSDSALQPVRTLPLLACSFLSGATLLALEVVWFRFLTMYVLSTTLAASLMLGAVLAGIGLGGLAASAWLRRNPDAARHLPFISFAAGCVLVGSYAGFQVLTEGARSRCGTTRCGWPAS